MPDMQRSRDTRNIAIDKVGVKDIRYPIVVLDRSKVSQQTVARINMYVDLPHHFNGTHMSRFIEILNQHHGEISVEGINQIVRDMKEHLEASCAHLELEFPYFNEKAAPVSGARSLMEYQCRMAASHADENDFVLGVTVPVTSLCPSRAISARGAHIQRRLAAVTLVFWLMAAGLSVMAFDSGVTAEAWAVVLLVWSYPILPIGLIIAAWIAYRRRRNVLSAVLSGLSFAPPMLCILLIVIADIAWFAQYGGGLAPFGK